MIMAIPSGKYTQVYIGVGTALLLVGGMIVVHTLSLKRKQKKTKPIAVDYGVFDSKDAPGSGRCIDRKLLFKLILLQKRTGYPVLKRINSGVRSAAHNAKVGGVSNSSHLIPKCQAVDIHTPSRSIRDRLVIEARNVGFKRIGVGRNFVHLDVDSAKSQYVAWGYPKGAKAEVNPFT